MFVSTAWHELGPKQSEWEGEATEGTETEGPRRQNLGPGGVAIAFDGVVGEPTRIETTGEATSGAYGSEHTDDDEDTAGVRRGDGVGDADEVFDDELGEAEDSEHMEGNEDTTVVNRSDGVGDADRVLEEEEGSDECERRLGRRANRSACEMCEGRAICIERTPANAHECRTAAPKGHSWTVLAVWYTE
ncbi:unnamed protein product [Prorocentrum cordatum]|uniref:Uncharacterized protein n=1 Tax=Prorocentrum cordatum TaxID=2364126 RepID=A0ABN9WCC1_9DINO|nr:unnamed protein product [Polarella glacialis]